LLLKPKNGVLEVENAHQAEPPNDKSETMAKPNETVLDVKRSIEIVIMRPHHESIVETSILDDNEDDDDDREEEETDDDEDDDDDLESEAESTQEDEEYDDFDVFDGHASHSVEDFLTEGEKEERRQALALEQQQRFLAHVQAGRATRQQQQQRLVDDNEWANFFRLPDICTTAEWCMVT
jgi:hypothetical protein